MFFISNVWWLDKNFHYPVKIGSAKVKRDNENAKKLIKKF